MKTTLRLVLITLVMTSMKPASHNGFHAFAADEKPTTVPSDARVFDAVTKTLKNGLQVVVIPNHRAPILTHMLWIRAGAADESATDSGIAHFLEHLMFKGTKTSAPGSFSRDIAALGGDENAFTGQDFTAYFATLAPEHLPTLMAMERDRFLNLAPPAAHVASELDVVIEERRQRTENDPLGAVHEQMNSILYGSSAYANPVIGWMDDMKRMTWEKARAFKDTWYVAPNMILVISGDIVPDTAFALAEQYYSDLPAHPAPARERLQPPRFPGVVVMNFTSDQIAQAQLTMGWRAPSYAQDAKTSLALQVLSDVLDGGASTRLYQDLVVKTKRATSISLSYDDSALYDGSVWVSATPAPDVSLNDLQRDIFATLGHAAREITDDEVHQAITRLTRQAAFARDSVAGPAMIIGQAMATGATLDQVETWPAQIAAVTPDEVRAALQDVLLCVPAPDRDTCQPPLIAQIKPKGPVDPRAAARPVSVPNQGRMH